MLPYILSPPPPTLLFSSAFDSTQAWDQVTKSMFLQRSEGVGEGVKEREGAAIGENMG